MSHNGCTITNTKSEANIFINHYARFSKFHMTKEDRYLNRLLKKCLKTPSVDSESCTSINMSYIINIVSDSEDETQRSRCSRQLSTNTPQINWSFSSPPGTTLHIQCIILPRRLTTDLESRHHSPIAKGWEITKWRCFFSTNQCKFLCCKPSGMYHRRPTLLYRWI